MASRVPNNLSTVTKQESATAPSTSSSMDLLAPQAAESSKRPPAGKNVGEGNASASNVPAPVKPSTSRATVAAAAEASASSAKGSSSPSPARISVARKPTPAPNAASSPSPVPDNKAASSHDDNTPIAQAIVASSPPSSSSSSACKAASDCPSNICISGACQTSSGFVVLAVTTASTSEAVLSTSSSSSVVIHHKGKHGASPTACSDPRCTLPASITSMNGLEDGSVPTLGEQQRAVSSAATAGIVLALLFTTLAMLLILPKVRDWASTCIGRRKKSKNGLRLNDDDDASSPDFGNHHASAFIGAGLGGSGGDGQEKRRTGDTATSGISSTTQAHAAAYHDKQRNHPNANDDLPIYENGNAGARGGGAGRGYQADIADMKMDYTQETYFETYNGYPASHQHYPVPQQPRSQYPYSGNNNQTPQDIPPTLPEIYYNSSSSEQDKHPGDLSSYIEHNDASPAPAISASSGISGLGVRFQEVHKPAKTNTMSKRDAQARETVLPYTVEEDRDVLLGLKSLQTPAVADNTTHAFTPSTSAYMTPVMQQGSSFSNTNGSPLTPITPGSAYSVRTQLLPSSLRPGGGGANGNSVYESGRAPILKQSSGIRPSFKRFSAALRFDSSVKRS